MVALGRWAAARVLSLTVHWLLSRTGKMLNSAPAAQSLARKCHLAFGMKIIYTDALHVIQSAVPSAQASSPHLSAVVGSPSLRALRA